MPSTTTSSATGVSLVKERALQDALTSERSLRAFTEDTVRDLLKLITDLALRFDGERIEQRRRNDPNGLAGWAPADWRAFFDAIPIDRSSPWADARKQDATARWNEERKFLLGRITELKFSAEQVAAPDTQEQAVSALPTVPLLATTSTVPVIRKKPASKRSPVKPDVSEKVAGRIKALGEPARSVPEGAIGSLATLLSDLKAMQSSEIFPKKPPAAWRQRLDGNGRKGGDLTLAYQRYWSTLWIYGRWGIVSKMEAETLIALSNGLSTRSGALGRVMNDLLGAGVLIERDSRLSKAPSSALKMFQLSGDGKSLFKLFFERDAVRDELSVMYEKHEGERFPDHTLAVLIFALHARRRGWQTHLMPAVEGKGVPDLSVSRGDESFYVEVERGQKEKTTKWQNIAELNDGTVALCAMTPKLRRRLVGDCKLLKIKRGVATDLKTLVTVNYADVGVQTDLWDESW